MLNTIPITQQLVDFSLYEGDFSRPLIIKLFKQRHQDIEDRRRSMPQKEFLESLSKYDKLIYQTHVKYMITFIIHFIIFIIMSLSLIFLLREHIQYATLFGVIVIMSLILILSYKTFKYRMIKKVLVDQIIEHDLYLFLKIANRAYYNQNTEQLIYNYQLINHIESSYDQFVIDKPKHFIDVSAIKDIDIRKRATKLAREYQLTRDNLAQYITLQINLIEQNKDIVASYLYNNDYIQALKQSQ